MPNRLAVIDWKRFYN